MGISVSYMYEKKVREGNKKEKGNRRGKQEEKGVEMREREIRKGNEKEMRKLSDCSPFNNIQYIHHLLLIVFTCSIMTNDSIFKLVEKWEFRLVICMKRK